MGNKIFQTAFPSKLPEEKTSGEFRAPLVSEEWTKCIPPRFAV